MDKELENRIVNKVKARVLPNAELEVDIETYTTALIDIVASECAEICNNLSFTPEGPSHEAKYQRALCAKAIKLAFKI